MVTTRGGLLPANIPGHPTRSHPARPRPWSTQHPADTVAMRLRRNRQAIVYAGHHCLMKTELQFGDKEKVWETDSDGCTTMWLYLMPVNLTLKMVTRVSFVARVFLRQR